MNLNSTLLKNNISSDLLKDFFTLLGNDHQTEYCNKTVFWKNSDHQKHFYSTIKEKEPDRYSIWKDKQIEYRHNNLGFRSDINFEPGMEGDLYLGCSLTEGIGLPVEYTWVNHMSKYLNNTSFNLGQGGRGIDTAYRLLLAAHNFGLKFNRVFLFTPPVYRQEHILKDNNILKTYLTNPNIENKFIQIQFQRYLSKKIFIPEFKNKNYAEFIHGFLFGSELQSAVNSLKSIHAIQGACNDIGCRLYYVTFEDLNSYKTKLKAQRIHNKVVPDLPSRDGHWSAKKQYVIFQSFLEHYPELIDDVDKFRFISDSNLKFKTAI